MGSKGFRDAQVASERDVQAQVGKASAAISRTAGDTDGVIGHKRNPKLVADRIVGKPHPSR